jgi:hypothetical protein
MMMENRTILVAVGLVAAVVCAALLIRQSHAKRETWRAAVADHHAAIARCQELGRDANERIQAARKAGITRRAFTKQFGEISIYTPEKGKESPPDATHVFTHEPSHRVFYLRFDGDVLAGVSSSHGPDDIQPHLPSIEQRIAEME